MPDFLHLRLSGPMHGLQGPRIDGVPQALRIPGVCATAGLLAGALGIGRDEPERLQAPPDARRVGVVIHRPGVPGVDFQTTDLTTPHMRGPMWMRGGRAARREGSPDALERHVQRRPYLFDADMSVVAELGEGAGVGIAECAEALRRPRWMRHLGRTCCPPDRPILQGLMEAGDLRGAVRPGARPRQEG